MTLTEFLLARIAEDEADARLAMQHFKTGEWTHDGSIYAGHEMDEVVDWVYNEAWAHIARHDPARVLAECEAKRRIVELHGPDQPYCDLNFSNADHAYFEGPCQNLQLLALPYADHPDYREEWRP